jgi:hypothetical protein
MPTTTLVELSLDLDQMPLGFTDELYVQMMVTYALFKAGESLGMDLQSIPKQLKVGIDLQPCMIGLIFSMPDDATGLRVSKAIKDEFEKAKKTDVMDIVAWANS